MTQYIDKAAVVADIEGKKRKISPNADWHFDEYAEGYVDALKDILNFLDTLDTLEVKEVDLNKELNDFIEEQKAWVKDDRVVEYNNGDSFNHIYDLREIAEHFFELGIKARKEE